MEKENKEKTKWTEIREKLNQNYEYDDTWEQAIKLFQERLKDKYFKPIQLIIGVKRNKGEGFSIVTLQCALIEMFSAFRQGKIHIQKNAKNMQNYEYKESTKIFTSLLLEAPIFKDVFWQQQGKKNREINTPYNASDFYKYVRCGLMHEARTKENWCITSAPKGIDEKTEKCFIKTESGQNKIYRTVLHYKLLEYLDNYSDELRQDTPDGKKLRKHFARKLDHLFDFQPNSNYDWWTE